MNKLLFFILILSLPTFVFSQKKKFKLPSQLQEVSGLYLESSDRFWWHNDSGSQPILYRTNGKGELTDSIFFPTIKNVDWEDLTYDSLGNIYIGDFGNNRNKRQNLRIYIFNFHSQALDSIMFAYPDQETFPPPRAAMNFDMEAFFWWKGRLHLFSKNKTDVDNFVTKHYILQAKPGWQIPILNDQLDLKNRVVTAAAISPDGKTVALLSYYFKFRKRFLPKSKASIIIIRNFEGENFLQGKITRKRAPYFILATQYESLDFLNNNTIYIASEKTKFINQKAKRIRLK